MAVAGVYRKLFRQHGTRNARRLRALFGGCLLMLSIPTLGAAATAVADTTARILFIASQRTQPYTEFVEQTRHTLETGEQPGIHTETLFVDQLDETGFDARASSYDLVVAVGTQAAFTLSQAQAEVPVIYTLIPEITFEELVQAGRLPCRNNRCSALYIDQPLERQLRILHAAFGEPRLGVVFGPASRRYQPELRSTAERYHLHIATTVVEDAGQLLPALRDTLQEADVLLALPDPLVYNSRTAQSILLTTYRYKVPLVAFSRAYVDAGATLSVFSTPDQMAAQAGKIISDFIHRGDRRLPPPAYPEKYRVQVNHHVARSIGLDFEQRPEFLSIMNESNNE